MEFGDRVGFDTSELAQQELSEEPVIPIPLPPPVERNQEHVGCRQLAQHRPVIAIAEDCSAERCREVVEHGGSPQEPLLMLRKIDQGLVVEVVGDEPIVTGHHRSAAVTHDRGREEHADGPSLGALDDLGSRVRTERQVHVGEDLERFCGGEREVGGRDLHRIPGCAGVGQVRLLCAARDNEL